MTPADDRNLDGGARTPARRRYHPPKLFSYGDVRDLTLGGSPFPEQDASIANFRFVAPGGP